MISDKKNKIGVLLKTVVAFGVVLVMFSGSPIMAVAAEANICHKHTGSCYENQPIHCQDDTEITTFNQDFNCATCGRVASARVVVETYSCKYMYLKRELRRMAYCYTCNSVVQHEEKSVSAIHTRLADVCVCGMEESTVITIYQILYRTFRRLLSICAQHISSKCYLSSSQECVSSRSRTRHSLI